MATNITNTLTAVITSQADADSSVPINRGTGNPSYNENFAVFETYVSLNTLGANPINVNLPYNGIIYQLYVRNIDPSNLMTVAWTANVNGPLTSPAIVALLGPGDQLIYWQNPSVGGVNGGISKLTFALQSGSNSCLFEYFIGG